MHIIVKRTSLTKLTLLLCILVAGSSSVCATDYTYTYTFSSQQYTEAGTKTLNGVSWIMAGTGGPYFGYSTKGQQFGSGSKTYSAISLSTTGISGTITSVAVNTSGGTGIAGTVAVSVGSTSFQSNNKTTVSLTATATSYTFTGKESGEIVISWEQTTTKAIYVKSITVTYSTDDSSTPSISAKNVEIAYNATSGAIGYSMANANGNVSASVTTGKEWLTLGTIDEDEVHFTCSANTENTARTATVTLTYTEADDKVVTVTQLAAPFVESILVTIGSTGWATFSSAYALDFEHATPDGLMAYMVTGVSGSAITLSDAVDNVSANTGLLLNGTVGTTFTIPVLASSETSTTGNLMKACVTATTVNYDSNSGYNYVLAANAQGKAEFQLIVDGTYGTVNIPAGKAYLALTSNPGAPALSIDFDGTTGVNEVRGKTEDVRGEIYNLAGQRIAQPTKGLYIVNGKKVVVK